MEGIRALDIPASQDPDVAKRNAVDVGEKEGGQEIQIHKAELSAVGAASQFPGRLRGALDNHGSSSPELAGVMQHSSSAEKEKDRHAEQDAETQRMAARWNIIDLAEEERRTSSLGRNITDVGFRNGIPWDMVAPAHSVGDLR
ncbi:unnamed protein product [Ectocarpus sp. 13 AM-2016]